MSADFEGFRAGGRAATLPAQFFTEVLPCIDDPDELRVAAYALYAIARPGKPLLALRGSELGPLLEALFKVSDPAPGAGAEESWDRVRTSALGFAGSKVARDFLQTELLNRTASFQGLGAKPYALDIARILDAMSRTGAEPDT